MRSFSRRSPRRGVRRGRRRGRRSRRMTRLPEQRGERIERDSEITFSFDGKNVAALEGDTIGSALFASGQRTFSRSFKYHRPRGLLCCAGQCPNCLVQVDGAPGVRACTEPVREGMKVEHMNASPSLDFDVMRTTDLVGGPFTPPGFYYKTFIRPRRFWPLYEKVLRHAAGLGKLRKSQPEREWRTEYRRRHADILVIGGGAAGLNAAAAAAELGADVVLADEGPEPGGRLLAEGGVEYARELVERARAAGVEILDNAPALGTFDGLVPVWQGDTLHQVRAKRQIHATGAIEQPLLFPGNDLPGRDALRRRAPADLHVRAPAGHARGGGDRRRPRPPRRARADRRRGRGGLRGRPARERPAAGPTGALQRMNVEVLNGATVLEATRPRARVERGGRPARLERQRAQLRSGPAGGVRRQRARHLAGRAGRREDLVRRGARLLHARARARGRPRGRRSSPATPSSRRRSCPDRWPAPRRRTRSGSATRTRARAPTTRARAARPPRGVAAPRSPCRRPVTSERSGKCFACLCEDVTAKDIHLSVEEGYDSIELSKRYTTTTMGPCQGRMCQLPAVRLMAKETGTSMADVGTTTPRPPWHAVPMGALAGRPVRAGEALLDPRAPPRAGRERDVGGRLAPRLRLRRPEGRGDGGAQGGRADRRLHARQADRARPGRRRVPRPPLPEPVLAT